MPNSIPSWTVAFSCRRSPQADTSTADSAITATRNHDVTPGSRIAGLLAPGGQHTLPRPRICETVAIVSTDLALVARVISGGHLPARSALLQGPDALAPGSIQADR